MIAPPEPAIAPDASAPTTSEQASEKDAQEASEKDAQETSEKDAQEASEKAAQEAKDEAKKKKRAGVDLRVKARVIAGLRGRVRTPSADQSQEASSKTELQLRQARLGVRLRYKKIAEVEISAEFSDFLGNLEPGEVLRDAYANVRVHKAFQITVGQFKRPYSGLELRGSSKLPMISRGLFNSIATEDLTWGDRAMAGMIWGSYKPKRPGLHKLEWYLSASNNAIADAPEGVDVHARLVYEPLNSLSFAASGAYKHVTDALDQERDVYGANLDMTVDSRGFYASVEADLAQDWTFGTDPAISPWVLGALAYSSYDLELGKNFVLQPAFAFEYLDANLTYEESEAFRALANLNLKWSQYVMVRAQIEYIYPLPPVTAFNPFVETQIYGLWLQVQI
ncbi:Phosphate-selective porin O and P [Enhygromyxa salina]|uniref:Phosphate-selective porin O and P n=1 Tax=Enhygromyxa salina TaxID=215803 RepID=A0A2S9YL93_9BACT|nr:porin [Enhygromyxa salina]PRQ05877.1 Phosphate-selective porin O and P [Enhygromyxa salina]